jgi:hypothetical protein
LATINIERKKQRADIFRAYIVKVDGKTVAKIRIGEKVTFQVEPGNHELVLTIDWCRSSKVKFVAHNDEELHFKCGNSFCDSCPYLVFLYITFLPHKYLYLHQYL